MGSTFEVWAWRETAPGKYGYEQRYAGEDYDEAVSVMKRLKAEGCGCVKLEWR